MIDYGRLDRSIKFYELIGFPRIESPWVVTKYISSITKPDNKKDIVLDNGDVLVASGEQSFLYLYLKGYLPKGRFQTTTACFRDDEIDLTHTKYFMKNEIIITDDVSEKSLLWLVDICKLFFEKELKRDVEIVKTEEGYDLEVDGTEIGSYGIRKCDYLEWIYGTGCPEPRLSIVIKSIENKSKKTPL